MLHFPFFEAHVDTSRSWKLQTKKISEMEPADCQVKQLLATRSSTCIMRELATVPTDAEG